MYAYASRIMLGRFEVQCAARSFFDVPTSAYENELHAREARVASLRAAWGDDRQKCEQGHVAPVPCLESRKLPALSSIANRWVAEAALSWRAWARWQHSGLGEAGAVTGGSPWEQPKGAGDKYTHAPRALLMCNSGGGHGGWATRKVPGTNGMA